MRTGRTFSIGAAVTRGPLVYCAEEADNNGSTHRLAIGKPPAPEQIKFSTIPDGLLKGVKTISLPGVEVEGEQAKSLDIKLVPYYSWNNRGLQTMSVWIPRK